MNHTNNRLESFFGKLKEAVDDGPLQNRPLKKVKQFELEKFSTTDAGAVRKKLRAHSERYRKAVRATHLIANEMADIENDEEFDEMLKLVLNQWRNVRQMKRGDYALSDNGGGESTAQQSQHEDMAMYAAARLEFDIS
ncbi:hypothetical protein PInf_007378 [Phytophthora infestans]|nr:hypothetical protein PInf_007378 [Phytophthora infestans]